MRKIACESCALRRRGIIADLRDEQLESFHACSTVALYRPRQVIFHAGASASGLYILCHGAVKLYQSDRFGRDHILAVATAGDILGELPSDPLATYSAAAEALTEAQLCYLSRARLTPFLEEHPMVGVRLIAALSAALGAARRKVRALALKPAEGRLAELLIQLANANNRSDTGRGFTLRYSRRELAQMIGVSTETVIRILGRLKRKRAISTAHRELIIADMGQLAAIANHDTRT